MKAAYKINNSMTAKITSSQKVRAGLSGLGMVAGILVAVKRKSGFWGGCGWFIVGAMAGNAVGWLATAGAKDTIETV